MLGTYRLRFLFGLRRDLRPAHCVSAAVSARGALACRRSLVSTRSRGADGGVSVLRSTTDRSQHCFGVGRLAHTRYSRLSRRACVSAPYRCQPVGELVSLKKNLRNGISCCVRALRRRWSRLAPQQPRVPVCWFAQLPPSPPRRAKQQTEVMQQGQLTEAVTCRRRVK